MLKIKFHKIIYLLGFLFLGFIIISCICIQYIDYDFLIDYILDEINRKDLHQIITEQFFTKSKFLLVKKLSIGIGLVSIIATIIYYLKQKWIVKLIEKVVIFFKVRWHNFKHILTKNSQTTNLLLLFSLLIILARSIYFALDFDIQLDEAWNYNYFLNKNIAYTLFAYNNYPLQNITTWFFLKALPDNTFTIRLPSIIMGLATCISVFVVIKKTFKNEIIALLSMLIFASLPISIEYMLRSRGVMFELFFIVLVFYFLINYLSQKFTFNTILFISFLNALGTYSMLSHAYFIVFSFGSFFLILLLEIRFSELKYSFYYLFFSIVFSLILLIPMFVGTGVSLGVNAGVSHANYLAMHYPFSYQCYSAFITGNKYLILLFAAISFVFLFQKNVLLKRIAIINFVLFTAIFFIPIFSNATPAERTLGMLILLPLFILPLFVNYINQKILIILSIIYCLFLHYSTLNMSEFIWSKKLDKHVLNVSEVLLKNNIHGVSNNSDLFTYFIPGITYYFNLRNQKIEVQSFNKNSTRYATNLADYNCIVVDKKDTINYGKLIYNQYKFKIFIKAK